MLYLLTKTFTHVIALVSNYENMTELVAEMTNDQFGFLQFFNLEIYYLY